MDYILEVKYPPLMQLILVVNNFLFQAMQHHGLGHLPQPDNFTTCGQLGIEINQYNNPVEGSTIYIEINQ